MTDLISIIIPIYGAEKYLHKCVDSVLAQSYKNIEVLLIDDGSPDRCPEICDFYAKKDLRVKVFHKQNGGVSSARNIGIDNATGKYLCFLDSDDSLPLYAIQNLYCVLAKNEADCVMGSMAYGRAEHKNKNIENEFVISFEEKPQLLLDYIVRPGSFSSGAKIYSGLIIKENNIHFHTELKCSEDAVFVREYLCYCKKIVTISNVVYLCDTSNNMSLSKKGYINYCEYHIRKLEKLKCLCSILPISEKDKRNFISFRAIHGLRTSTNHYLTNWDDKDEKRMLVEKSVNLLKPWIDFENNGDSLDELTREWWKDKGELVQNDYIDDFFDCLLLEQEKARCSLIVRIKRRISKLIRR